MDSELEPQRELEVVSSDCGVQIYMSVFLSFWSLLGWDNKDVNSKMLCISNCVFSRVSGGLTSMAKQLKSSPWMRWDPIWAPVLILAPPLPIQPLLVVWESSRGWPNALVPCTCMGDLKELLAPGFGSAQHRHCTHLGSESSDGRSSALSRLLSLYLTL